MKRVARNKTHKSNRISKRDSQNFLKPAPGNFQEKEIQPDAGNTTSPRRTWKHKRPRDTRRAEQKILDLVRDDEAFNSAYHAQWAKGAGTVALNYHYMTAPDWQEANRIRLIADAAEAAREALKNPDTLRACVHHFPAWTFKQERITYVIGKLAHYAHHGAKKDANTTLARQLLEKLLLPIRPGGGSPDITPATVQRTYRYERKRITTVLSQNHRQRILSDLRLFEQAVIDRSVLESLRQLIAPKHPQGIDTQKLSAKLRTLEGKIWIARIIHQRRCAPWVYDKDIECAIAGTTSDRYAVQYTGVRCGLSESEVREKLHGKS